MTERLPILDVKTRWNSIYLLLERAIKLRIPLDLIARQSNMGLAEFAVTDDEWTLVQQIFEFLQIFYDITLEIEGNKTPTLSLTVPLYDLLLSDLKEVVTDPLQPECIKKGADAAITKIIKYYK